MFLIRTQQNLSQHSTVSVIDVWFRPQFICVFNELTNQRFGFFSFIVDENLFSRLQTAGIAGQKLG